MAGTKVFQAYGVPADDYDRLSKIFYNEMYSHHPKIKVVYELIKENPTTPLGQLHWTLRTTHNINRSVSGLKKIALQCGLPYCI
jgi:hemoglobin-like flavoprotein